MGVEGGGGRGTGLPLGWHDSKSEALEPIITTSTKWLRLFTLHELILLMA